jgi:archaellum component FlaF (FlaF/FlaG flagellin family)
MKKSTIILAVISVILLVSLIFNFIQLSNEKEFSSKLSAYLSLTQKECPSGSTSLKDMSSCLDNLMAKLKEKPVLVEAMFVNYYLSTVQSRGILIFKNIGTTSFESSKFKLYLNNEVQDDDGCEKEGSIAPDGICSLTFKKVCQPGDTLHVEYDGRTILTKSC